MTLEFKNILVLDVTAYLRQYLIPRLEGLRKIMRNVNLYGKCPVRECRQQFSITVFCSVTLWSVESELMQTFRREKTPTSSGQKWNPQGVTILITLISTFIAVPFVLNDLFS